MLDKVLLRALKMFANPTQIIPKGERISCRPPFPCDHEYKRMQIITAKMGMIIA